MSKEMKDYLGIGERMYAREERRLYYDCLTEALSGSLVAVGNYELGIIKLKLKWMKR